MKRTPSNAALAILLGGASFVMPAVPAFAQDASKPTPGANLQYTGADTRFGIGIDSDNHVRGELFQVLRGDDKSATLAEIWGSRNAGGAKLSQHWTSGTSAVNKVFAAFDQGDKDLRKATVGGGQEYEKWFWNTYLSKGLSGARLGSMASVATTATQRGVDAGRPYEEDVTTTVTNKVFTRPYDYGVGARLGHFYEPVLVRVTAGLDYEWGKFSSRQWTGTLTAEKFFANSPLSVAISGELFRRSGDFEGRRNDQRGLVMLRYELGGPQRSFRSNKITRMVSSTERVPDPNWRAPVVAAPVPAVATAAPAAKPAEPTTRIEKRIIRSDASDAQETYFDLSSSKLKPAAFKELDALVGRIAAQRPYVELKVNIVGHTCPTGGDRNNVLLSTKRAEAVKAYLVSKGVPIELVTATGQAGRSPKYPEVKGQSFRNRRADTEVLLVKERAEDVSVAVPAVAAPVAAPVAPVAAVAPPAVAPMIERQVQREVTEDVPNNWMSRALHNPAQHKSAIDTYRWVETDTAKSTGARRYINRPPTAIGDAYTIDCNAPVTFNVLANDTDPDGDVLTITSVSTPGKGSAAIVAGRIVYTPAATTCSGVTDSFTYAISDGRGGTATATVAVTINPAPIVPPPPPPPVNNPPVAVDDVFIVPCKSSVILDVLANDSDKDGDSLTITSITQPSKAGIAIGPNGKTLIYNPTEVCFVRDTFTYTISDGKGGKATATVTLIDP